VYVVGTAGHVDHGKSTLVKALTGMDPDRLQEEKDRGMTIDLGFAWLRLPGGNEVSIVDVPGHERFIKNMLAGVGGIDLALLVVAADEGVMPQTLEHLAIIDLLQVQRGIVALTKRDLVDDDWLELVTEDVRARLRGTVLASAPIVPVSAVTGQGLTELKAGLVSILAETPPKRDIGRPRLPVDRIFTIGGFGTVVTGTLVDGRLQVGQEVEILPRGLRSRIRGLQTHKKKAETAVPGSRVAVNLVGLAVGDLARGDVLTLPGWLVPTTMVDARLRLVADLAQPLRHNAQISLHTGAAEVAARVRLLTGSEARAGETVWVQLELEAPVALVKGDYFVIRSPNATLGGGQIVDAHARRRRRNRPEVIAALETLARGSPEEVLLQTLADKPPVELGNLVAASGLTEAEVRAAVERLAAAGQVVLVGGESQAARGLPVAGRLRAASLVVSTLGWDALRQRATTIVAEYHGRNPLRQGMPKEELKSRLALPPRAFNECMSRWLAEVSLADEGAAVRLPTHSVRFSPQQEQAAALALKAMARAPFAPPPRADLERDLGADLLQALLDQGRLLKLSEDVILTPDAYRQMVDAVLEDIRARGATSVAAVRDRFNTSRRYAIALLEHLDETRVTRRQGDDRVLY
jgi:selenocysteine-specific elongation factor